jgi:hypothetical protein
MWCLNESSTHKTTMGYFNPHGTSTQHYVCCDVLPLQHFVPVMFYYATFRLCDVLLLRHFVAVTFYYCNIPTPICYVQETDVHPTSEVDVMSLC